MNTTQHTALSLFIFGVYVWRISEFELWCKHQVVVPLSVCYTLLHFPTVTQSLTHSAPLLDINCSTFYQTSRRLDWHLYLKQIIHKFVQSRILNYLTCQYIRCKTIKWFPKIIGRFMYSFSVVAIIDFGLLSWVLTINRNHFLPWSE